jgi:hypothetical protein
VNSLYTCLCMLFYICAVFANYGSLCWVDQPYFETKVSGQGIMIHSQHMLHLVYTTHTITDLLTKYVPTQTSKQGPFYKFIRTVLQKFFPIIINLSLNNVQENVTHFTNLYVIFSCVTLAHNLCSSVVHLYVPNHSTVLTLLCT